MVSILHVFRPYRPGWFDRQSGEKYIDVTWWIWLMHFSSSALAAVACTPLPCQVAERCFRLSLEARLGVLGMSPRKGYCRRHRKIQDPFTIVLSFAFFQNEAPLKPTVLQNSTAFLPGARMVCSYVQSPAAWRWNSSRTAESLTAFFTNRGDELGKATCCRILRPCGNLRAERRICMPSYVEVCWLFSMVETSEPDGDVHGHHHFCDLRWLHRFAGWFRACGEIQFFLRWIAPF